ncbi:MAG: glycosyltransferase family 4 protein [Rhodobiaceae bacterium]|nr:glycosyltransferase family 4 protein [Rhodobiaceae bacterium]
MSRIAVVVKGYPRLSETFIAQEIRGLEKRGLELLIVSLRHPTDKHVHPVHREIEADILYLPEYLKDDPQRVAAARRWAKDRPEFKRLMALFEKDLARDCTVNRWRRLGQALVLAHELPDDVAALYVHYLHTPCSVARYASIMTGRPFAFSAHAKDIWTSPDWELREKIADAEWGVTCTALNRDHLNGLAKADKLDLVYHGLDLSAFPPPPDRAGRTGPLTILSVGRLVEKKGYGDLLTALSRLSGDIDWRFVHIGGGNGKALKERAERRGLGGRIDWRGARPREDVIAACEAADIFVLPSRIARSGDRDGLPNVLMEAQAMGLPVVSTRVSAIPELVEDGVTGLLVDERDPAALADAIAVLARDPEKRAAFGRAGAARVRAHFASDPGLDRLAKKLKALR